MNGWLKVQTTGLMRRRRNRMANFEIYRAGDGGKFVTVTADEVFHPNKKEDVWIFYKVEDFSSPRDIETPPPKRTVVAAFSGILGYRKVGEQDGLAQPILFP